MVTAIEARAAVSAVADPEMPAVSIADLGILRDVTTESGRLVVTVTPTYSGCPAMDTIRHDITARLAALGVADVEIRVALAPAWTTGWITEAGRRKLSDAGIAPPSPHGRPGGPVSVSLAVRCPRCGAPDTEELSRFSATACTALWRCRACGEPFDRVKEH